MAEGRVKNTELAAIAAAIRSKNGESTIYKPSEMAAAIEAIPSGSTAVIESKSITENGTYTAPSGVDGYSPITVDVPNSYGQSDEGKVVHNGELTAQGSDTVTENGTIDTTLISSLVVNVSGSGSWVSITPTVYTASLISSSGGLVVNDSRYPNYSIIVLDLEELAGKWIRIDNTGNTGTNRNYWGVYDKIVSGSNKFPRGRGSAASGILTVFADDMRLYDPATCRYLVYDFTSTAQNPPLVSVLTAAL